MGESSDVQSVIAVRELSKQFPAVRALHRVSLDFRAGEVHGLIGENGAGKSTLMNILSGLLQPTEGQVLFEGRPMRLAGPADAMQRGVAMIHQEFNLIDTLSVADNIFLGREKHTLGFVQMKDTVEAARELSRGIGSAINPRTRVDQLSIAQKQMVEIAKAMAFDARVLIMDEPTAVLTRREVTLLFDLIARLRERGTTVIYISHILPEVLEVCDSISVLRDGELVTTLARSEVGEGKEAEHKLASLMVGREMADHFPTIEEPASEPVLAVNDFTSPGACHDVSFAVRRGEILGFAGLVGAGRTEMAEAIVGIRRVTGGEIFLEGRQVTIPHPAHAAAQGISYLSEDRRGRGLTIGMGIAENITLVSLRRYCHPLINRREEAEAARKQVADLSIKVGHVRDDVATLSGGNQQKVAIAKWLETHPRVLILDEPTRGVDIGAKEEIYRLIHRLAHEQGLACVLISSELNELLGMCHRIAVMREGRVVTIIDRAEATEELLMQYAAGVKGSQRVKGEQVA